MNKSTDKMSFEEALEELRAIASKADRGDIALDIAITAFERGALLKKHCDKILQTSSLKIEQIVKDMDGNIKSETLDLK